MGLWWRRFRNFWATSHWRSPVATILAWFGIVICVGLAVIYDRRETFNRDWTAFRAVEFGRSLAPGQSGVAIYGVRPFVDFSAQTATITWMPYACGSLNVEQSGCSRRFIHAVDFWVDNPSTATYTLNPARIPRDTQDRTSYLQLQPAWTFLYQHIFRAGTWDGHLDLTYHYPGDSLNCTSTWRATDTATGQEVPVLKVSIEETPTGYSTNNWDFDVLVNVTSNSPGTIARNINFTFYRSQTVMVFCVMIVIINWGLTLLVLHITLHFVIEGGRIEVPREILLLPVSIILTVPQLRAAMPDVPDFGILLDLIGYFFNIIIIALCSFVLVLLLIYQRVIPTNDSGPSVIRPSESIELQPQDASHLRQRSTGTDRDALIAGSTERGWVVHVEEPDP